MRDFRTKHGMISDLSFVTTYFQVINVKTVHADIGSMLLGLCLGFRSRLSLGFRVRVDVRVRVEIIRVTVKVKAFEIIRT